MKKNKMISLIVPCFNEEESIELFYNEFSKLSKEMNYVTWEVIFVDDGSKDKTLEKLKIISNVHEEVKYISFAKNFGKEYAMLAGLDACKGDYVAIIDADLQHPLKLLIKMYNLLENKECDCVAARSIKRNYNFLRKFLTKIYYKFINSITEVEMKSNATDYRLMTRQMVNAILSIREHNRYLKGIFEIVGFKTIWIDYEDNERIAGESKFNIKKLLKYAMTGIISFSQFPLLALLYIGMFLFFSDILLIIILVILNILKFKIILIPWLIVCCTIFIISITMISNGILGMYIAQIQTESKHRPLYIIKEDNLRE